MDGKICGDELRVEHQPELYPLRIMSDAEGGESCEELLNLLHQRMISTGEWTSLLSQMRRMLEESGWETQLREQAERRLTILMVICN